MSDPNLKKRIWGWFFFDWASQPYHTLLVTFIFGPYFASVATSYFMGNGLEEQAADAQAQSLWSLGLTVSGLIVGLGGPVMGALADASGRRMPWIVFFSALYVIGAAALWWVLPDGSNLWFGLVAFGLGFIGAEFALIVTNAQLPTLGTSKEIGKLSGSGFSFGYLGGFVALILVLLFLVEQANGRTLAGLSPLFGLDPEQREGTRFVGPFVALWFTLFMVPYFLWVRESDVPKTRPIRAALSHLGRTIGALPKRPSLASFLGGSMLYRDALNGLYGFGGTYAVLVLNWNITQIGTFGILSVISAVAMTWIGGRLDTRFGPKPVIIVSVLLLSAVCLVIVTMDRTTLLGFPVAAGSEAARPYLHGLRRADRRAGRCRPGRQPLAYGPPHRSRRNRNRGLRPLRFRRPRHRLSGTRADRHRHLCHRERTAWRSSDHRTLSFRPSSATLDNNRTEIEQSHDETIRAGWSCGLPSGHPRTAPSRWRKNCSAPKPLSSNEHAAPHGGYAKGCLAGGEQLPESGPTWQAMRLSRNRNWGHPETVDFIRDLSAYAAKQKGWAGLYIGDISQPRGGPMLTGHRSHQIGLDVDIWMLAPKRLNLSRTERESISSDLDAPRQGGLCQQATGRRQHHNILKAAARDKRVARIFVFPRRQGADVQG